MTQNPQVKFTYKDYLLLPEGDRRELVDGDFYVVPSPNVWHQRISKKLGFILSDFVDRNRLGEVLFAPLDVVLSDEDVVQPDILFISNERRGIITEANISGAPDLVVEVLLPSTADRDRQLKLRLYSRFGVSEYWIVDPDERSVQVMVLGDPGETSAVTHSSGSVSSPLIPGLNLALEEIFASY